MKIKRTQLDNIISQYYDEIVAYFCMRVNSEDDAYDLTQDVFFALVEQFQTINDYKVRAWLYSVAHNILVDYYKANKRANTTLVELEFAADAYTELISSFDTLSEREVDQHRITIISQLAEKEQILYREIYHQKKGYTELSKQYQVSEATMRKRVSRLSHKIRGMIKSILYLCLQLL